MTGVQTCAFPIFCLAAAWPAKANTSQAVAAASKTLPPKPIKAAIIDSGLTLSWLVSNLSSRGAKSVEIATLLRKPEAAKVEINPRYVGFDIPNEFVVGYGLDYAERYRNLPFVATLAEHVYGG